MQQLRGGLAVLSRLSGKLENHFAAAKAIANA
jgi:hypothetical protein